MTNKTSKLSVFNLSVWNNQDFDNLAAPLHHKPLGGFILLRGFLVWTDRNKVILYDDCKQTMSLINRIVNKLLTFVLNYTQPSNDGGDKTAKHRNFCVNLRKSERFFGNVF